MRSNPITDTHSVRMKSLALATMNTGYVHPGFVEYYWDSYNPFMLRMDLTVSVDSVRVTEDEFPGGVRCMNCHEAMELGQFVTPIRHSDELDELWCMPCGRGKGDPPAKAVWEIDLSLVRAAYEDRADIVSVPGAAVRVWRSTQTNLNFAFTEKLHTMHLSVALNAITLLLQSIDRFTQKQGDVEAEFLFNSLAKLELMANCQELP